MRGRGTSTSKFSARRCLGVHPFLRRFGCVWIKGKLTWILEETSFQRKGKERCVWNKKERFLPFQRDNDDVDAKHRNPKIHLEPRECILPALPPLLSSLPLLSSRFVPMSLFLWSKHSFIDFSVFFNSSVLPISSNPFHERINAVQYIYIVSAAEEEKNRV